jgi:two-component system LytT family sensor kinase
MRGAFRPWLGVWAGWTGLALLLAASTSLTYRSTGRPANWALSTERSLAEWWLWALLTPLVARLAQRFPLSGPRWGRHLAFHVVAGTLLAAAKTLADRAILALLMGFWIYLLASTFALQLVVYAGIVAAAHGVGYYRRSREREHLEARLAEARLQLLNLQLQPHFLFNALNTIAELVHEDPETADRMIAALSGLLRRTLDLGATPEISLDAELDLLESYLQIQRVRFGDRLRVTIVADEDVRNVPVPMLLLQPLVENAIRHGLARRREAGRIGIEARREGSLLVIQVTNDGDGAALETIREGVGLGNTRARLEGLYGVDGCLELKLAENGGARVRVTIPVDGRMPRPGHAS